MKNTMQVALAALVLAGAATGARADLTISGAVGLPLNPTAQIPDAGGARVQANYYDHGSAGGVDFKQYGIYAAGRVANNFEINGGLEKFKTDPSTSLDKSGVAFGAKYLFTKETDPAGVRIAAGAGYSRALAKNTYVYLVGTKSLTPISEGKAPITGHLGLRWDKFKAAGDSDKVSVYAGVEVPVTKTGDFQLVGEIQSKNVDGGDMPYSAGVRYRPSGQPFGASIGIQRQGLTGDNGLYAQLGYSFSTK
jgi:hypothetical protein